MKLRAIRLYNVRQFGGHGKALEDIADGLNGLAAPNETGKSTFFDALQELLFKKHSSRDKHIQNLQPYSGGNPHIEADIELNGELFRIAKRFMGGPADATVSDLGTGKEIARQGAVQDWLDDTLALGDQGAGPAGLLWVRQGTHWEQGGGKNTRAATLSDIVAEQLDAVTAGERMRAMMDRTAQELAPLVTATGAPKSGGAYAAAIEELDGLTLEVHNLSERHASMVRDLDQHQRLERDLEDRMGHSEEISRLKTKLAEAEDKAAQLASDAARLPELRQQLTAARKIGTDAGEKLEAFVQARTNARALQGQIADDEARLPDLQSAESAAHSALAEAKTRKAAADEAVQEAEKGWTTSQSVLRRRDRQMQLDDLKITEDKALAADQSVRDANAAASLITIDDAMLDKIEHAAREFDIRSTQADASATSIDISYLPGQAGRISIDSSPLPDQVRHDVTSARTLEIDGIGTLKITPGGLDLAADAVERLSVASEDLKTALSAAGVDDVAAARNAMQRKADLLQEAHKQTGIVETLAPDGLDSLKERVLSLGLKLEALQGLDDIDPDLARAALDTAQEERAAAELGLAQCDRRLNAAVTALRDNSDELRNLKTRHDAEISVTGPPEEWEARFTNLSLDVGRAEAEGQALRGKIESLEGAEQRHDLAKAEVERLRQADRNRTEEIHRIEVQLATIRQRFSHATDEGLTEALQAAQAMLSTARDRHKRIALQVQALQRLDAALKSAHRQMRDVYFEPVNAELRPLLDRVLQGQSLVFDDDSFAPNKLQRDGRQEDIERLSGGTQEQIAILTRLAFAILMARNGRPAPLILDDALIFTDDERIEDMFTILNSMINDLQILVLTCRQRAFQSMGGNVLSLSDWRPDDD